MIEVGALYVFCAFHSILSYTLGFFGHHALKCVIDGLRVENHTPLSLKHDKEGGCANIALKMHCHAMFALCCSKTVFGQKARPPAMGNWSSTMCEALGQIWIAGRQ